MEHMEGKHAMERNQGMKGVPVAFFLKSLLFSYILTGALLALLAFLLYWFGLGERVVSIAIIAIYVVATFFSGFVAGKRMESRRFFWGLLMGSLYFAVLTGCLRIAKESVFTGLNNISTYSVTDNGFDKYFGFTDAEVRRLLEAYHLSDSYQTIRDWYDG